MSKYIHIYPSLSDSFSMVWRTLRTGVVVTAHAGFVLLKTPSLLIFSASVMLFSVVALAVFAFTPPLIALFGVFAVAGVSASFLQAVITDYSTDWARTSASPSLLRSILRTLTHPIQLLKIGMVAIVLVFLKLIEGVFCVLFVVPIGRIWVTYLVSKFAGTYERYLVFTYPLLFREGHGTVSAFRQSGEWATTATESSRGILFGTSLFSFSLLALSVVVPHLMLLGFRSMVTIAGLAETSSLVSLVIAIPVLVVASVGTALLRGRFYVEHALNEAIDSNAPFVSRELRCFQTITLDEEIER